jgi:hypothetical protein
MEWQVTDTMLLIIAVIMFLNLVVLGMVGLRAMKLVADLQQTTQMVNEMRPRFERLLDGADAELQEVRNLNLTVNRVVADVEAVTDEASSLLVRGLQLVESIRAPARYYALIEGAKAGFQALRSRDGGDLGRRAPRPEVPVGRSPDML